MALERKNVTFDVDGELADKVKALSDEGWAVEAGKKPRITYELVRVIEDKPPTMGVGKLTVDDSKIIVLRAGEKLPGDAS